jgi:hypothetical protein
MYACNFLMRRGTGRVPGDLKNPRGKIQIVPHKIISTIPWPNFWGMAQDYAAVAADRAGHPDLAVEGPVAAGGGAQLARVG